MELFNSPLELFSSLSFEKISPTEMSIQCVTSLYIAIKQSRPILSKLNIGYVHIKNLDEKKLERRSG